jgi:outer membrane lipase/esterase
MKTQKRVLPALLLSLFAATAAPDASAATFSNVYVFGDSLSDAGYYRPFLASVGLPAATVAAMGRFTTNPGPVWSELVATYYGVPTGPSNANSGNIFAQGGARVDAVPGVSTPPGMAQRPISAQVTEYLARTSNVADSNALYAMWGGANDVFYNLGLLSAGAITSAQLQTNVLGAATAEIGQIRRLRDAGARYILVFGLPNIAATPAFATNPAAASVTALSAGYNTTLFTGLQSAGIKVIPVDTFSFFNQVFTNAAAYGFTNTTSMACGPFPPITTAATVTSLFCNPSNTVAGGADTYLFADSVHPTSASHRITAQFVESLIEGPSQYGLLAEAPLRSRAGFMRSIGDSLARGRTEEIGKLGVFVGGNATSFKLESTTGNNGLDTDVRAGTVGVTVRASEAVTLGAAYGYSGNEADFGNNGGGFRTGEHVWALIGAVQWGGFYGTAILTRGDVNYSEIHRNIVLGPVTTTATARATGSNAAAYFSTGYDFPIGKFKIGPTVAVTSQNVEVGQFDEAGGGAAGLRILTQTRKSEVWSVGARASMDLGNWTPWARVTADRDRRDDGRSVSAVPLSMIAINPVYDVPAYVPESNYTTFSLGLNGILTRNVALSASYYQVSSRSNVKEDGFSAVVSFHF